METSQGDPCEMQAVVKGNVQGVGFRATTRYYAQSLGGTGTVCNLPDGTVKIIAQGKRDRLDALRKCLREEFGPSQIEREDVQFVSVSVPYEDFRIVY
jgi:acylphosphatase